MLTSPTKAIAPINLEQLQKYLAVSDEQVLGAAASLAMLSPVARSGVKIDIYERVEISHRGGCINIAQVDK
ncbi:hypothetical protein BV372_27095 [Nostoc sp. T09]|uniref:hypothetical protein n=1 Tax=Nostoc sp. T09 TaxID=1932621 RepID=UPI000A3B6807|nr:hypothetical protein [Nostoc sp. T09]OUL26236.1 hypothetical protein BV372_27095 [Nostoc sp. T09]